jgi:hypothetical protein
MGNGVKGGAAGGGEENREDGSEGQHARNELHHVSIVGVEASPHVAQHKYEPRSACLRP